VTSEPTVRVVIVDDNEVVRAGIASLLASCDDITVAAATGTASEALELCGELEVDVVLVDLALPEIDGAPTTAQLIERCSGVRVVALTGSGDDVSVRMAIQAGASACLLKTVGVEELAEAIRGVMQGRSTLSTELLPYLVGTVPTVPPGPHLTPREHDILELVAAGRTNKGIARALGLAEGTVRVYVSTILAKLGVANRTEATVLAIREGLVGPGSGGDSPRGPA